jgi:UDP-N-acetylglucosamine 1-carboxyvinyltransferase
MLPMINQNEKPSLSSTERLNITTFDNGPNVFINSKSTNKSPPPSYKDKLNWLDSHKNDTMVIRGGRPLKGSYYNVRAKNAVLPEMCAAVLTDKRTTLHNVPDIADVHVLSSIIEEMGGKVYFGREGEDKFLHIEPNHIDLTKLNNEMVVKMRASILMLGALLSKNGSVNISLPGGDKIGKRAIDQHLVGLQAMGAEVSFSNGFVSAKAPNGLNGAEVFFDPKTKSVGGTENIAFAAVLAKGKTTIHNASCEPEVLDVLSQLQKMGAKIKWKDNETLEIDGVSHLNGSDHSVISDRLEFGTIACAAAATNGEVLIKNGDSSTLGDLKSSLEESGVQFKNTPEGVIVKRSFSEIKPANLETSPYPGFATDLQSPVMALLALSNGKSKIDEKLYENRFHHVAHLNNMGADMSVQNRKAEINGVRELHGANVEGTDIRAAAALLIAGMSAKGTTNLTGMHHLDRGYDDMMNKLRLCGAEIDRVS